jgi:hypothetical protein
MVKAAWFPADTKGLVAELISTAESCGVELACLPHLYATAEELDSGKPSTAVDPDVHAVWRELFSGAFTMMRALLQESLVVADGPRFYGAMIVLLETMTQADGGGDAYADAMAILNDTAELGTKLREMEVARAARHRARDEAQLAAAAQVEHDPALVAELDEIDRLVVDELAVAVPLPISAQRETSSGATLSFTAAGPFEHVGRLYRCWAQREGWLIDDVLNNSRHQVFSVRRPDSKLQLEFRLGHWIHGRVTLAIEFPRAVEATILPGKRNIAGAPPPSPVTRERWPAVPSPAAAGANNSPDALLADGGLVFLSTEDRLWQIDPHAGTETLVVLLPRTRLRGLVALDDGSLIGFSALPITLHHLPSGSTLAVTTDSTYGRALTRIGDRAYVLSDRGRVIEVNLSTGAVADVADFPHDARSLAAVGATLYVSHDKSISAIDPETRAVRDIIELPSAADYLASDGVSLFTGHSRALGRVDLAARTFEQIAGQPQMGAGYMLGLSGGIAVDGPREAAVLERARFLSHDAGNLWFMDNPGLRRFDLRARHVATLQLKTRTDT